MSVYPWRDMARWYVWRDLLMCVPGLVNICDITRWCLLCQCIHDLFPTCDMTRWDVWRDSLICVPWLVDGYDITRWCLLCQCIHDLFPTCDMQFASLTFVKWPVPWHILKPSPSYSKGAKKEMSVIPSPLFDMGDVTILVDMCHMTRWYVYHDSFMCVTWLVDVCDMTRWCVWHDSWICVAWVVDVHNTRDVTWVVVMCDKTRWYV